MTSAAKFWDRIANKYAKSPIANEEAYQHKLHKTQSYLNKNMQLLEIGCGTGSTALQHAPFVKHLRAVDFSEKMIEIAKQKGEQAQINNVTFAVSTAQAELAGAQEYDMILALSILHLLPNRQAVIQQAYQRLKPGGLFVTSTACLRDGFVFLMPILKIGRLLKLLPYVEMFTGTTLINEFKGAGFEIEYQWTPGKRQATFVIAKKPEI
ncbi:class I SAM-dependent methyltransferase [Catenovulum sediminis]|uniref:Methyltransferase domain-containing protein n=1 Tax=Catenovulum sediminis TaxID=1740262 RepID=A0ABV1RE63_9ALTE|nr:class I SAM-dependent methyltransferase [Catenovulum sediminis]